MAASSAGSSKVGEVEELLAQAMRAVQSINSNDPPSNLTQSLGPSVSPNVEPFATDGTTASTGAASVGPRPGSSRSTRTPVVNAELQRLFPHLYGTGIRRNLCNTTGSGTAGTRNRKRSHSGATKAKKAKLVTRKFFCLADKDQIEVPSQQEKRKLFVHDLGEKKLSLPCDGSGVDLQRCLMEEFPLLESAGGFKLMYIEPGKRDLMIIPPGPKGHSVEYIANFIGQGRVYVRPIQSSIALPQNKFENTEDGKGETIVSEELCNQCLNIIPLCELRNHILVCSSPVCNDVERQCISASTLVQTSLEDFLLPPTCTACANFSTSNIDCHMQSSTATHHESVTRQLPRVSCPTCNLIFPSNEIEEHADICCEQNSTSERETFGSLMCSMNNTDSEQNDILDTEEDPPMELKDIMKHVSSLVVSKQSRVDIRRKFIWSDYVEARKRPWVKPDHSLRV
eukprot:gene1482-1639_t